MVNLETQFSKLVTKYNIDPTYLAALEIDLKAIDSLVGGLEKLKGKRILDLGCGSSLPEEGNRLFEPWLCRSLFEIGVEVVGIDIQPSSEPFEFRQLDLSQPKSLNEFSDKSFDGIFSRALVDSPTFLKRKSVNELSTIKRSLGNQIKRLLKENYLFLIIEDSLRQNRKSEFGL